MGIVTAHERLFLEIQLKVALDKLKRDRNYLNEVQGLGNRYISEIICADMGATVLTGEKDRMFQELNLVTNHPDVIAGMRKALYQDKDMEWLKGLTLGLREQIGQIIKKYESHVKEGSAI